MKDKLRLALASAANEPDYWQKCYQLFQHLLHVIPPNFDFIIANDLYFPI